LFKVEDLNECSDHCQLMLHLDCYYTDTDVNVQLNDGVDNIRCNVDEKYIFCNIVHNYIHMFETIVDDFENDVCNTDDCINTCCIFWLQRVC